MRNPSSISAKNLKLINLLHNNASQRQRLEILQSSYSIKSLNRPTMKRKADEKDVSPPPSRRKVQSMTTQNSVSSFFKPASQKKPEKITWTEIKSSLLVARYKTSCDTKSEYGQQKRRRVAAFDLDHTLIMPSSGKRFSKDGTDWTWWNPCVPTKLRQLDKDGFRVVILSNQAGISLNSNSKTAKMDKKRLTDFKAKVNAVLSQLDITTTVYAATEKDMYRKPRIGMWTEMVDDYDLDDDQGVDLANSLFVGDAGGRVASGKDKKDFSTSDRNLAANIGVTYHSPEEFFFEEVPRSFLRAFDPTTCLKTDNISATTYTKQCAQELVLLCGSPASGKSTFYWSILAPLGFERVNQDILKTRDKCLKVAQEYLENGKSVAVDNTNADTETRAHWIQLGNRLKIPVRCILMKANAHVCEHNDAVRALNQALMNPENRTMLPKLAFTSFASRYKEPRLEEGLQDITAIDFKFEGNDEQRAIWTKFWA